LRDAGGSSGTASRNTPGGRLVAVEARKKKTTGESDPTSIGKIEGGCRSPAGAAEAHTMWAKRENDLFGDRRGLEAEGKSVRKHRAAADRYSD